MTLAASIETNDGTVTLTGIVIALSPTYDPNALQELWRAADSAGAPDSANAVRIAALAVPTGGFNYVDCLATDGTSWWYRTRMTGGPYGDSTYGDWVNLGTAARLARDGAVNLGVVSAAASSPAWTQATSRPGTHTQQMLPNFGFEDGLAFWLSVAGTMTVLTDSTKAHSGNKYLQVTSTTGNAASATACDDASRARYFEVSPGDVVQFGGWAYQESGTANVRYKIEMTDKDKGGATTALTGNQNTAAWVQVQAQQVIPAGVKYVRLLPDIDATGTGVVARFDDVFLRIAFGASTIHNAQGSIVPIPADATIFGYTAGGATTGHMFACIATTATYNLRRPDGSTIAAPATNAYDRPAAPTLTQVAAGAAGARTLFARIAYAKRNPPNNATVMYRTSTESSLAVLANNQLKVTSPAAVTGYDGYVVLVGTATNAEVIQQRGGGGGATDDGIIAFGTDWTGAEVTSTATRTPYDASMDSGFTIYERAASTTYKGYLYFDNTVGTGAGVFRIAAGTSGNWITAADEVAAQEQNADGKVALSFGVTISPATPVAGGGNNTGLGSGGKFK